MRRRFIIKIVLSAFLQIAYVPVFGQAMVFGSIPSYTPINLRNKQVLDTAQLEVRYQLTWNYVGEAQTHVDDRTVFVGRNYVLSRNESLYQNDSVATELLTKGAKGIPLYSEPVIPYEVLTNYKAKTVQVGYRIPFDGLIESFVEPSNMFQWTFCEDSTQAILGYTCNKATATYRGKKVTAWFTEDLPYNAGPYCFSGLPGLIMKVKMDGTIWQAIGIRAGRNNERMYSYAAPRDKQSREKAIGFLIHLYEDPVAVYSAVGVECSASDNPDKTLSPGSLHWALPCVIAIEK